MGGPLKILKIKRDPLDSIWPINTLPEFWRKKRKRLSKQLIDWYTEQGRFYLPWKTTDPYAIWISEVMLQQTQVKTVIPKYQAWMSEFPTVDHLANASLDRVMKLWEGLGYYARAKNLHFAAQTMMKQGVRFPADRKVRLCLPGVGASTASAIGAFAWGSREAILDGNVLRVWSRWLNWPIPKTASERQFFWSVAQHTLPIKGDDIKAYNQAIMDLGAMVCTARTPLCDQCPWSDSCQSKSRLDKNTPLFANKRERPQKRKTSKKAEFWFFYWIIRRGRVGVIHREDDRRWPGLWTPYAQQETPLSSSDFTSITLLSKGTHQLSHRTIHWSLSSLSDVDWSRAQPPQPPQSSLKWISRSEWEAKSLPQFLRKDWNGLTIMDQKIRFKKKSGK